MSKQRSSESGGFKRIVTGSAFVFVGNLVGAGSAFAIRIVAGKHLGPSKYGLVVLGFTALNILSIAAVLGLREGLARYISQSDSPSRLFSAALLISVPTAFIFSIGVILLSEPISAILSEPRFPPILITFILTLPLLVLMRVSLGALQGYEDAISRIILQNILYQALAAALVIAASAAGLGGLAIAVGWATAIAVAGFISVPLVWLRTDLLSFQQIRAAWRIDQITSSSVRSMVVFSLPLVASEGMWRLLIEADKFILGYFLSSTSVGVYDAAFTLARMLLMFTGTLSYLFLPIFSELHSDGNLEGMQYLFSITTKWMVLLALPALILLIYFPREFLVLIFDVDFVTGSISLIILSLGFFTNIIFGMNREGIISIGDTELILKANAVAFIINLLLNIILIPIFGIKGAAIASALSFTTINTLWGYIFYVKTGIQPLSKDLLRSTALSLAGSLFLFFVVQQLFKTGLVELAVFSLVYLIVHSIIVIFIGDVEQEIIDLLPPIIAKVL